MKNFLTKLYNNHVLANLLFIFVLAMGFITYKAMPREQDPTINFNWITITTIFPGASAEDVEKLVTDKLEEALHKVHDIKYLSSNSRESVSNIIVRFHEIDERTFDKRITDLRREIQNKKSELPDEVHTPTILEITSSNAWPSATIAIIGSANDEMLRKQAKNIKDDLERIDGVDRVESFGLQNPELQVLFDPQKLSAYDLNSTDLKDTIIANFRDISAGSQNIGSQKWLIRWLGKSPSPEHLANIPILKHKDELLINQVADVKRSRETEERLVSYKDQNAIMLSIMKQSKTNTLDLIDTLNNYIKEKNENIHYSGIKIKLLDDQTEVTRNALNVMQTNAVFGLAFVLFTTWLFLGFKISLLVSIGIPFTLAGAFWILDCLDQTLNVSVLLGVVITLGMLVDDAVVVVEAIYFRLSKGVEKTKAIISALDEIFAPVTTSVLTTGAAFIPLMLLPGILGKFMMVIPLVVTISLLISLVEAYWMLPAHIGYIKLDFKHPSKAQKIRNKATHWLRIKYIKLLIKILRYPKRAFALLIGLIISAILIISTGLIHINFFASDPIRLFYVNIEMPAGTSLQTTLEKTKEIEHKIRKHINEHETRSIASYSGFMFTELEPFLGDQYGQIIVSLNPQQKKDRHVDQIIEDMRKDVVNTAGPLNISFLRLASGPPTSKPINVKVRGNNYTQIRRATRAVTNIIKEMPHTYDIENDDTAGRRELQIYPDSDAIRRAGLSPIAIGTMIKLMVNGEIITSFQHNGEKVDVRLKAKDTTYNNVKDLLQHTISLPNGNKVRFLELVKTKTTPSNNNIKHYNFKRSITVSAEIDKNKINTVQANNIIKAKWKDISSEHPGIDLFFSGALDEIQESINEIPYLFLLGVGIIYTILGTQFASYWQPLLILITIPLAFTGVTFGLLLSNNPLSLYTLYGIVALSGITVNASIVLISAANERLEKGMSLEHATIYAARRRLIPILITSLTTVAGLFSLATGLGGKSLLWGPVATSIVWGLMFSTTLTLFFMPVFYRLAMNRKKVYKK